MDKIHGTRKELSLGEAASGTIDVDGRNLSAEMLAGVERDVMNGRFDVATLPDVFLPCGCIDGRCPQDSAAFNPIPNAAGGTLSLLVGELLTTESNIASTSGTSEESLASLIAFLETQGYGKQVGGHTGPDHGSESASGCGANDALPSILGQFIDKSDIILNVLRALDVPIDTDIAYPAMIEKARSLLAREQYFDSGKTVATTLLAASPEGNCPRLEGSHNEVLIRLNTRDGTTVDRRALREVYGDDYQIFNVDMWSLHRAADALSYSAEEAQSKLAAMTVYQVATALQLCGPSMRVIVR